MTGDREFSGHRAMISLTVASNRVTSSDFHNLKQIRYHTVAQKIGLNDPSDQSYDLPSTTHFLSSAHL